MSNIQHVIEHIEASYPCSMQSIINWCIAQGFEGEFGPAIGLLLADHKIELDTQDDELIVNPL